MMCGGGNTGLRINAYRSCPQLSKAENEIVAIRYGDKEFGKNVK